MLFNARTARFVQRGYSSAASKPVEVKSMTGSLKLHIPVKRHRRSDDLLVALSQTVHHDPTAARYEFVDEPGLTPADIAAQRQFALSKEAGKKAARWLAHEWPTLFIHEEDEPRMYAFHTLKAKNQDTEVGDTQEELLDRIQRREVSAALTIYDKMIEKEEVISSETLQKLFQLLCYYNSKDDKSLSWSEQFWCLSAPPSLDKMHKKQDVSSPKWDANGNAEMLWQTLEDDQKTRPLYSAMIAGLARFGEVERANDMRLEALDKGLTLDLASYRELAMALRTACNEDKFNKELPMKSKNLLEELLADMVVAKIKPDVTIFNCYLKMLVACEGIQGVFETGQQVLSEMKAIGVEPSLGSYYLLLSLAARVPANRRTAFSQIILSLQGKEFQFQDLIADSEFFNGTMHLIRLFLPIADAAHQLHKILSFGDNAKFLLTLNAEIQYYSAFLDALMRAEERPKAFFKVLNDVAPRIISLSTPMCLQILDYIEHGHCYEFLPQLYDAAKGSLKNSADSLIPKLFLLMLNADIGKNSPLNEEFAKIVLNVNDMLLVNANSSTLRLKGVAKRILNSVEFLEVSLVLCVRGNHEDGTEELLGRLCGLQENDYVPLWKDCEQSFSEEQLKKSREIVLLLRVLAGNGRLEAKKYPMVDFALSNLADEVSDQMPLNNQEMKEIQNYSSFHMLTQQNREVSQQ